MSLNTAQRAAVSHKDGPCLVLAGPGSGKTLTIAKRIEYLINEHEVRPEEILVITFTRYAAKEMRERTRKLMSNRANGVTFGTFHGIFYGILKWAFGLNQGNILPENERFELLSKLIGDLGWDLDLETDEIELFKDLIEEIGNVKNNLIDIEEYESEKFGPEKFRNLFKEYESWKMKEKKLDFDDMLVHTYRLFIKRPDICQKWQEKYKYILVDEFQDSNTAQYEVLKLLAAPENNLFVVGDDDQSIYAFRGAKPGIMRQFVRDYKNAEEIQLNINYRSGRHIVNGALRVIENNKSRFPKEILPEKRVGENIHVQEVKNPMEECQYVCDEIRKILAKDKNSEIAILTRTTKEAELMAEVLSEVQVPYATREQVNNLYDHFIAKDMAAYFHLAKKEYERKHFLQVANRPNRYLSRESLSDREITFEKLRVFYMEKEWMVDRIDQFEWELKMKENKTPYAAIEFIRKAIGYNDYLKEYASFRQMNYGELKEVLDDIQERAKPFHTMEEWFLHVERYGAELKEKNSKKNPEDMDGVALLTMHGAKGLEFDHVFIISANEGTCPYKRAKAVEEIEEERRLFYVAMTRAKTHLTISYVKEKNGKDVYPSRFVDELFHIR